MSRDRTKGGCRSSARYGLFLQSHMKVIEGYLMLTESVSKVTIFFFAER